jgi:predicted solute-binding protein
MIELKSNNHINEINLDYFEAREFIKMLIQEYYRHYHLMISAQETSRLALPTENLKEMFWKLQYENHKKDCEMIQNTISYLSKKYNLNKVEL